VSDSVNIDAPISLSVVEVLAPVSVSTVIAESQLSLNQTNVDASIEVSTVVVDAPVALNTVIVNAPISIGGGSGGSSSPLVRYFTSTTSRTDYYNANPEELIDGILSTIEAVPSSVITGTYLISTHTSNAILTESDLNTIHIFESAGQLTLPEITTEMIGKWVRLKKDTTGTVVLMASGSDKIEGDSYSTDSSTELADFIDVVAEGLTDWGVHEARGTWVGTP